jgi:hypothetical protein
MMTLKDVAGGYGTTSHNMTPMVKATIIPITIALDAIFFERINDAIIPTAAVAEISAAGAITHGTSFANHARVCIVFPFHVYFKKFSCLTSDGRGFASSPPARFFFFVRAMLNASKNFLIL